MGYTGGVLSLFLNVFKFWSKSLGIVIRPSEEGMATHSSIIDWRICMDRGVWQASVHGVAKSGT